MRAEPSSPFHQHIPITGTQQELLEEQNNKFSGQLKEPENGAEGGTEWSTVLSQKNLCRKSQGKPGREGGGWGSQALTGTSSWGRGGS